MKHLSLILAALLPLTLSAQTKLSDLIEGTTIVATDLIPFVDVSDTTMAATGTTKKATITNLTAGVQGIMSGNAITWTALQTITALGIAETISPMLALSNTSAASAGTQQWSPSLRFVGAGWSTTGLESRPVVMSLYETTEAAANGVAADPMGALVIGKSINGATTQPMVRFHSGVWAQTTTGSVDLWGGSSWTTALNMDSGSLNIGYGFYGTVIIGGGTVQLKGLRFAGYDTGLANDGTDAGGVALVSYYDPINLPHSLRVYKTKTSSSNYERLFMGWDGSSAYLIAPQAGGSGGSVQPLHIRGLPTSSAGLTTGTLWNDSGIIKAAP